MIVRIPRFRHGHIFRKTSILLISVMLSEQVASADGAAAMGAAGAGALGAAGASSAASAAMMAQSMMNMMQGQQKQSQPGQQAQGMEQMAMAALQALMALLGALAAMAAQKQGNKDNQNKGNMNSMAGGNPYDSTISPYGTSPTGSHSNDGSGTTADNSSSSSLGETKPSNLDLSPPGLYKGQLGQVLGAIEKTYGIDRNDLLNQLKSGTDPKDILAGAPKNAPSEAVLDKLMNNLAGSIAAAGLNGARLPASSSDAMNADGAFPGSPTGTEAAKAAGPKALIGNTSPPDEEGQPPAIPSGVSPEVAKALAARMAKERAEKEMADAAGWTIFQLVHHRYQKVQPMMYGRVEATNINPLPVEMRGF